MTIAQAIILGVVQGLTEFLPISSSGHLIIFPELLGWEPQGMVFDVAVHVATLLAILLAFRKELAMLARNLVKRKPEDMALLGKLALATLPAIAVGGLLGAQLDRLHVMPVVAAMLIVWGVLLWIADRGVAPTAKPQPVARLSWRQALVIGLFQACALVPGTSRSGATITGALFLGLERTQAVRFSFLLAIPAILAAAAKTSFDVVRSDMFVDWLTVGVGFVTALLAGLVAIRLLFYVIDRWAFRWFALYRIVLGIILLWVALY